MLLLKFLKLAKPAHKKTQIFLPKRQKKSPAGAIEKASIKNPISFYY